MTPRLLNEKEAKEFLGGASPGNLLPPLKIGGRKLWDRVAIERHLDNKSGLTKSRPQKDEPKSALEAWTLEHGDD